VIRARRAERSLFRVTLSEPESCAQLSELPDARLDALRRGNPTAAALPLLRLVARRENGEVMLPYVGPRGVRAQLEMADAS
jgi:hypothetical protein